MSDMRAITIRQPWASLIAAGAKTIETRPRPTKHRGLVLIHAGAATTFARPMRSSDFRTLTSLCVDRGGLACFCGHPGSQHDTSVGCLMACTCRRFTPDWPLGAIVATAQLIDCVPIETPDSEIARGPLMLWTSGARDLKLARHVERGPLDADEHPWVTEGDLDEQLPYGDFRPGRWGLLLDDIRPLVQPVPAKGQQAVPWRVPDDVAAAVSEQFEEAS